MSKKELQAALSARDLSATGTKAILRVRLETLLSNEEPAEAAPAEAAPAEAAPAEAAPDRPDALEIPKTEPSFFCSYYDEKGANSCNLYFRK